MMIPTSMASMWQAAANHLWQSTLFAIIAGLLTLALRKNQARTRYWLWFTASVKFLIPFSLLVSLGSHLARPRSLIQTQPGFHFAVDQVSQPFTYPVAPVISTAASSPAHPSLIHLLPAILAAVWLCGFFAVLCVWCIRWRRISLMMRDAAPLRAGRELEALRRMEKAAGMRKPIELLLSPASLEPGIFGIARPVLVWPEGISARLQDAHLEAILAHEICHARRRDNLTAAMHMVVEAVFWFHPLVWWLGARLLEERERACDEEVLQLGNRPRIYAESILKTCEYCLESPLACVSGVTGADLKKRIVNIMATPVGGKLNFARKLLLNVAGMMAVGVPLVFGLMTTTQSGLGPEAENSNAKLPAFEVASIKPDNSDGFLLSFTPDGYRAKATLKMLIEYAYGIDENQILGLPDSVNSQKYDIEAKEDDLTIQKLKQFPPDKRVAQVNLMLQSLLADRFSLKLHREMRDLPIYALVVAKNLPKLQEAKLGEVYPHGGRGRIWIQFGKLDGQAVPISALVEMLRDQLLGRTILDKTGLKGNYDFTLQWTPDGPTRLYHAAQATDSAAAPSLFTALQEQLGLKLESTKGPVEVLVVDHIERPTPN